MVRLHGPNWQLTVRSVHSWLTPNSPVWLPLEKRRALFGCEKQNIFFICGTDVSEPFDLGISEGREERGKGGSGTNNCR
jgi:hypothetical protein